MDHYKPSTAVVGLMPRLLIVPATASWAVPFCGYLLLLSARVVSVRIATQTMFGSRASSTASKSNIGKTEFGGGANKTELGKTEFSFGMGKKNSTGDPDPLYLANRCLGNYLETVPMAVCVLTEKELIMSLVAELSGANRRVLSCSLSTLFLLKVGHVELGLRRHGAAGVGRVIGYYSGQTWLAGMAGYCAYLSKDYWWY